MIKTEEFPHQGYPLEPVLGELDDANNANANNATSNNNATDADSVTNTTDKDDVNITLVPPPPPDPCEGVAEGFCTCAHPARRLSLLFGVGARKNKTQWCNERYVCVIYANIPTCLAVVDAA